MANTLVESLFGQVRPSAGNPLAVSVLMCSTTTGLPVTGILFSAVTAEYHKFAEAFADFPGSLAGEIATENWTELGNGEYLLKFRQEDGDEYAATDTSEITVYCSAAAGQMLGVGKVRIAPADVTREDQWTDARALKLDFLTGAVSSLTAQQVWEYGTRTLTSFGTLVADIWANAVRTLTSFGTLVTDISAAVTALLTGGGANVVTVTVTDGSTPQPNIAVTVWNQAGTVLVAGARWTNSSGVVDFNLDDGTYLFVPRDTNSLSGGSATAAVSGATAVTLTMTPAVSGAAYAMTFGKLKSLLQAAMSPWMHSGASRNQVLQDHLALWVQDGIFALDAELGWTQARDTIATVADQRRYTLDGEILRVQYATYEDAELEPLTTIEEIVQNDASSASGTPAYWSWYGGEFALYPPPDTSAETIELWTVRRPAEMTQDSDVPTLPAHLHSLILMHALYLAYMHVGEVEKGQASLSIYQTLVREALGSPLVTRGIIGLRRDKET